MDFEKLNVWGIAGGLIVLAVAIWLFITSTDPAAYLGAVILAIVGIAFVLLAFKKKKPKKEEASA